MVMSLQNHCDRVKMACLAQLVNIIGAIMTETGGKAWAQTIYYPYMYGSVYGNGNALDFVLNCDKYDSKDHTDVPYVATSVIHNSEAREVYTKHS
jgi:alpha-N-arabinofuranosidase